MGSRYIFWITCLTSLIFFSESKVLRGEGAPGARCEIENGVMGECEKLSSCMESGGISIRNGTMKMCSKSNGQEYICCRRPYEVARQVCESWKSYWRDNEGKCVFKTPMIVGGEEAGVGQFPEITILGTGPNVQRIQWICGGTLISPRFVLTAAHCVLGVVQFAVRLGDHDLFESETESIPRIIGPVPLGLLGENELHFENRNEAPVEQFVLVNEVIIHPEYDGRYNDIALLKLQRPVILTKRVLPACLPTEPEDYNGQNLTAAGWGRVNYESNRLSPTLQKVSLPVIQRTKCWEDLNSLNSLLIPKGVTQELLCAGTDGKDSCKGDSGGPLLIQTSDIPCEHSIAGIVSFGPGCGRFGVYTRVSSYVDWITGYIAPGVVPTQKSEKTSGAINLEPGIQIVFPTN